MFSLFNLSLQLNRFPIKKAKTDLVKITQLSDTDKAIFIENQKKAIVAFHLKNNSFYQKIADSSTYDNWESLPVLNKKNLQQPLIERLSTGYGTNAVYVNKTSGSSGTPFILLRISIVTR